MVKTAAANGMTRVEPHDGDGAGVSADVTYLRHRQILRARVRRIVVGSAELAVRRGKPAKIAGAMQ